MTLESEQEKSFSITCLSDLHGHLPPDLPPGDILILAGDYTATHSFPDYFKFFDWIERQPFRKKIVIAGNHDNLMESDEIYSGPEFDYLRDSGTEFEGLKVWGSPWTLTFPGQNPKAKAFSVDYESDLIPKWDKIPKDIDILITHTPPYGFLDLNSNKQRCGSLSLLNWIMGVRPNLKLCVFGHIHEEGGKKKKSCDRLFLNASRVDEKYRAVNDPVVIEFFPTKRG